VILKHATSQIGTCSADNDIQKNCVEHYVNCWANHWLACIWYIIATEIKFVRQMAK